MVLICRNLSLFAQGFLQPSLVEIGLAVMEKNLFECNNIFSLFVMISPCKIARMLCVKFGWNCLSGCWGEDFKISSMFFRYIVIWSRWKTSCPYLNKLEFPSPKGALCQVWLKVAQWFLRGKWKYNKFTDGRTEKWPTTGYQKSSLELLLTLVKNLKLFSSYFTNCVILSKKPS